MSSSSKQAARRLYDSGCTRIVSSPSCPPNMGGKCPRYMTSKPGSKCTDYMVSLHDSTHDRRAFDAAMFNYCERKYRANGRTEIPPECECLLRNEDPDYRQAVIQASARQLSKEADQCWYLPCRDARNNVLASSMMLPGDPKNVYLGTDVCTGVTCSQLVDARGATLGVAFIDQKTGCSSEVKKGSDEGGAEGEKGAGGGGESGEIGDEGDESYEERVEKGKRLLMARALFNFKQLSNAQIAILGSMVLIFVMVLIKVIIT